MMKLMKLKTYDDMSVNLIRKTEKPGHLVQAAMTLTMTKQFDFSKPASTKSLRFLVSAEHTSLLEHVSMTFAITGISRSLLAQLTRQRTASPTSSSQHYADHSDMPMIVHPDHVDEFSEPLFVEPLDGAEITGLEVAQQEYQQMIKNGVPIEEARQVLPNACAVNYLWTIDARNLYFFLRQRMCKRNVTEMQTFAKEVWGILNNYWPELAECCGPYCYPTGKCNQGRMSCGDPYKPENK